MKKLDRIPREILHRLCERGERFFQQRELAATCELSVGTVNPFIKELMRLGAIESKPQGFRVVDMSRLLTYWSVKRDLPKDIAYTTSVPGRPREFESNLPSETILTAYSGYRHKFGRSPTDYREVYVYADPEEMKKKFKPRPADTPNLFVLRFDDHLKRLSSNGVVPIAQLYVDLWQLGRPASKFVKELEWELGQRFTKGLEKIYGERANYLRPRRRLNFLEKSSKIAGLPCFVLSFFSFCSGFTGNIGD